MISIGKAFDFDITEKAIANALPSQRECIIIIGAMTAKQMWDLFRKRNRIETQEHDEWAFGDAPDELAQLVLEGKKRATASVYELYEYDGEKLPQVGGYSVIMDSKDQAVCVIVNTDVRIVPFCEVDEEQARLEGEGDLSLEYWRKVHRECFKEWMEEASRTFGEDTKVVLETFRVVFSGKEPVSQPR